MTLNGRTSGSLLPFDMEAAKALCEAMDECHFEEYALPPGSRLAPGLLPSGAIKDDLSTVASCVDERTAAEFISCRDHLRAEIEALIDELGPSPVDAEGRSAASNDDGLAVRLASGAAEMARIRSLYADTGRLCEKCAVNVATHRAIDNNSFLRAVCDTCDYGD